jgi:dipeptidyl aminopeptidase/acylaminoacyl peptidase
VEESQRGLFASVSRTGVLAWADARGGDLEFVMFDRDGRRLNRLGIDAGQLYSPVFSPDGTKILFFRAGGGTADVWLHDLAAGTTRQVTTDPGYDEFPEWSPDGKTMAHIGSHEGKAAIFLTPLDGVTPPRVVREGAFGLLPGPWTPDGRFVLFSAPGEKPGLDLWALPVSAPDAAMQLSTDSGNEGAVALSPDGRWVIISNFAGGNPEPYVTRLIRDGDQLHLGSQRVQLGAISQGSNGAAAVFWRRDGREILTSSVDGQIVSIPVTISGDVLTVGKPVPLFRPPASSSGWAANADGTRFVVVDAPLATRQSLHVLTNWESRLK